MVANARPAGEARNPWVFNLPAAEQGRVTVQGATVEVTSREPDEAELDRLWAESVEVWPAFGEHHAATGERTVLVLEAAVDDLSAQERR